MRTTDMGAIADFDCAGDERVFFSALVKPGVVRSLLD